ncbi:E2 protein [Rusa timorensis papillomavirus type 2]|uniref:Regulatory protein E2 n=1 Tax=Rusa timorensis papillomavirus type 2 TaxID=1905556 RepID=A0A2R2Z1A9_9PAPI|nr:E2 protein [Rusa timorensis papillomavirus type 2]AOS89497.1 E2 protein [Rusa timorensis papillomavirus type 2]
MAAAERLSALLAAQMQHIENDSQSLTDHIHFWRAVRQEQVLLHAARKHNLRAVGMWPVPTAATSAVKAKQAITMELLLTSLLKTDWGRDPWTLSEASWERLQAPPKYFLKKEPKVIEVIYDNDSSNRVWYTVYGTCLSQTADGWFATKCEADNTGCYVKNMNGEKDYYVRFEEDAVKFSTTGTWEVLNPTVSSSSSPDRVDGQPPSLEAENLGTNTPQTGSPQRGRPAGGGSARKRSAPYTTAALPDSPSGSSTGDSDCGGSRCAKRLRGCSSTRGSGDLVCLPALPPCAGNVSQSLAQLAEASLCSLQTPDSTQRGVGEGSLPTLEQQTENPVYCLIFCGNVNDVKCLRWRFKKHHKGKYTDCTTTYQHVGDSGNERKGPAMIMVTFSCRNQRDNFANSAKYPPGVTCKKYTMLAE